MRPSASVLGLGFRVRSPRMGYFTSKPPLRFPYDPNAELEGSNSLPCRHGGLFWILFEV